MVAEPYVVIGNHENISYLNFIDSGGFGEVHKLYLKTHHQEFARKLMRPFGPIKKEDIEKEVNAVKAICKAGKHKNIIDIFRHGVLPGDGYYYIDMEFCDINLEDYIHGNGRSAVEGQQDDLRSRQQDNWSIMTQISKGLGFLHESRYAHRDLKPRNILYHRQSKLWKLTDFGIMCQATSKNIIATAGGGTQGYRAPELLRDPEGGFTNKVDIWAVGCILYEVVTGNKLFANDYNVREYHVSDIAVNISVPEIPQLLQLHLSELATELLHRNYRQRPSAEQLTRLFHGYMIIVRMSIMLKRDAVNSLPKYREWKDLISDCPDYIELGFRVFQYFKSLRDYNAACLLCITLILRVSPRDEELGHELAELYGLRGDNDAAIAGYRLLIESLPSNDSYHPHLTAACQAKGGNSLARKIWQELADSQPRNALWQISRDEVIVRTCMMEGDWETAIVALKRLINKNFDHPRHIVELESAVTASQKSAEDTIAVWADVVHQNPWSRSLQDRLSKVCDQLEHPHLRINVWENLIEAHPTEVLLHNRLSLACKLTGGPRVAVAIWEGLMDRNPGPAGYSIHPFSFPLKQALRDAGDARQAVLVWQRRVMKEPGYWFIQELKTALDQGNSKADEVFAVWSELLTQYPYHKTLRLHFELAYTATRRLNNGVEEIATS